MALAKFLISILPVLIGACGLVWSMLVGLGPIDPGSNPGRPTTSLPSSLALATKGGISIPRVVRAKG